MQIPLFRAEKEVVRMLGMALIVMPVRIPTVRGSCQRRHDGAWQLRQYSFCVKEEARGWTYARTRAVTCQLLIPR